MKMAYVLGGMVWLTLSTLVILPHLSLALAVPGNGETCGEPVFTQQGKNNRGLTPSQWQSCIAQRCGGGSGGRGHVCDNAPGRACQRFCMADTQQDGTVINCCSQVVRAGGCTRVAGVCGGQLPPNQKDKQDQGKQDQGGQPPKMPEMPKSQGGGGQSPQGARPECMQDPKPVGCTTGLQSLFSNYLGTGTTSTSTEGAPKEKTSPFDRFVLFVVGGDASDEKSESTTTSRALTWTPWSLSDVARIWRVEAPKGVPLTEGPNPIILGQPITGFVVHQPGTSTAFSVERSLNRATAAFTSFLQNMFAKLF